MDKWVYDQVLCPDFTGVMDTNVCKSETKGRNG